MASNYITIVSVPSFAKDIEALLTEDEIMALEFFLAIHPEAGDVIPGTGGIRKLRWAAKGRGKRGGARVVYYYFDDNHPLFCLAAYGKNEKIDLNASEKKQIKAFVTELKSEYRRKIS